jgi:hypothetical protein
MAFQNIIFKEYLNLVYKNGENYEITLFYGFSYCLHPFSDKDPDPEPSSTDPVRIWQKFRILADPDPQH